MHAPRVPSLRAVWQSHLDEHDPDDCGRFGTPAPDHHHGHLLGSTVPELVEPFVRGLLVDLPGPTDIVPFTRLDGDAAAELLDVLAPPDLDGRQNDAPTLRAILEATASHPDRLDVHGYAVGPGRCDERLTAEGVHVRFDDDVRLPAATTTGATASACGRTWSTSWVSTAHAARTRSPRCTGRTTSGGGGCGGTDAHDVAGAHRASAAP
ncbi:hypothetical protein GCM10025864_08230 [Luteimicrobium album]|uniref:Uncharacterized protein n=1 Tax=Luteimicrobium album TaxID=1054550 RepID=A0ABQ6HX28_9MICO|nr:hypothetical protein [Luteimicrobium album]GMA23064.1 hypothetical protein GCM10025864_08230 [Luteimicrobium album]